MAELAAIVGLVASIASLVDLSAKVVSRLYDFTSKTSEVPESFRSLSTRLPLLTATLQHIQSQAEDGRFPDDKTKALKVVVDDTSRQVSDIQISLSKVLPSDSASKFQRMLKVLKSLAKGEKIQRALEKVNRNIDILILYQTTKCVDTGDRILEAPAPEDDCLQSLWPMGIDYESQKNQNPLRVPDTCEWTLRNPKYLIWRDDKTKKLLWVSADPGCGKSVLARCIIDEDLPQNLPNTSSTQILYYFFKDTSPEQRSATRAVSTILHQLLAARPQLIRHALPSYREIGAALSQTFPKLWSIFSAAVADPLSGDVICVLDALDECNEQDQQILTQAIQCILSSNSRLKILITSRPYYEIRFGFYELLDASSNIELAGNNESASIKQEINLVIKHRVKELAQKSRLPPKVEAHLEKRLLGIEHRTYLWLRLIWEVIRKSLSGTVSAMNKLIDNLPVGIHESYEALLQRCDDPSFAKIALQIVLVAGRPLTLEEMDIALHVNEQTLSYADLELEGSPRLQETLPSRCGLMISIIQSKVYFIHQSVKEFLIDNDGIGSPSAKTWQQSLTLQMSHKLMTDICLRVITFSDIQVDRADLGNAFLPLNEREMGSNEYCQSYSLLSYAAIFWADHYQHTKNYGAIKFIESFLTTSSGQSIIGSHRIDYGTTLHAASAGGHDKVVQMLLDKGADVNAQGGRYSNALQAASFGGYNKVVQMLLDKGADVNAQGGRYSNALQAASFGGYNKVVQILLDKRADVNAQGGYYGNALQAASCGGHEEIARLLLDKGADFDAQGGSLVNALIAASLGGHIKVVQILLKRGVETNVQAQNAYGNALYIASWRGHNKVVQMLLEHETDVNIPGGVYNNPLSAAVHSGNQQIVQWLLEAGADPNIQGGEQHDTVLQAASAGDNLQIVQMLLEAGADINAGGCHGTALQEASTGGKIALVEYLLSQGADINMSRGSSGTALQAASLAEHEHIVLLLLGKGADLDIEGGDFNTALQAASFRGNEPIVRRLIEAGANVNRQGGAFDNPLWAAKINNHKHIEQLLTQAGAKPPRKIMPKRNSITFVTTCKAGDKPRKMMILKKSSRNDARLGAA